MLKACSYFCCRLLDCHIRFALVFEVYMAWQRTTRVFVGLSCKNKTESKILRVFLQYIVQVAAVQEFWESVFNGFMVISSNGQLDVSTLLSGVKCESGESLSCILTSGTFVIWLWNTFVIFRAWKYIIDPGKRSLAKQQRTNSRSTV